MPETTSVRIRRRPRFGTGSFTLTVALVILALAVIVVIVAPLTMADAANTITRSPRLGPSLEHPLGTDSFGRDMLARTLVSGRLTLGMAITATAFAVILGAIAGTGVWLAPRRVREAGLRVLEIAVSFPGLLVALMIAAILGAGVVPIVIAIGVAGVPSFARLTANLAASISHREYITTSRLLGVSAPRMITRHVLPNIAEPLLILIATGLALSIVEIAGLSFVGLGVQSPEYDLGKLLKDALPEIYTRPLEVVGPATAIAALSLGAMLLGDAIAAHADPRAAQLAAVARRRSPRRVAPVVAERSELVRADGLTVSRADGVELVKGISFTVGRGEIVGIVGESGSGKSLTAMALAQLLPETLEVSASELSLGGLDLLGPVDRATLAKRISLVYQDPGTTFNPVVRMGTQLTEVSRSHLGHSRRRARTEATDALKALQITMAEARMSQLPHELSGGMRQRAMISTTLVTRPELIIADEPTTALDVTVQAGVLREFKRLNREQGTAILFISHDIEVVEALCDTVLVMSAGEIVERVSADDLARRAVQHPYTRRLLEASPSLFTRQEVTA